MGCKSSKLFRIRKFFAQIFILPWAMSTSAAAAISPFEVIRFCKNHEAVGREIKITIRYRGQTVLHVFGFQWLTLVGKN